MQKSEVAELVAILQAAFTRPPMTEATVKVYVSMLEDLEREPAHRAVARLIATAKWLPTIAEIRAAAVEVQAGARRLGMEAWGDVCEAIQRHGVYPSLMPGAPTGVSFADPLVAECVRIMGWRELCLGTNDAADRARFCELYDGRAERARRELVAGTGLALPAPKGGQVRQLGDLPDMAAIGNGGRR